MSSASILRRSTNQPAITNRRACAKQEDILLMQNTTIWRTTGMITTQTLLNQGKAGSGQEPTNMQRRTLIGGALAALLSPSGPLMAQGNAVPRDPFIVLLKE